MIFLYFIWKIHKIFVKCAQTDLNQGLQRCNCKKKKKVLESNIEGVCTEIEKTGTNFKFSKISIKNPNF